MSPELDLHPGMGLLSEASPRASIKNEPFFKKTLKQFSCWTPGYASVGSANIGTARCFYSQVEGEGWMAGVYPCVGASLRVAGA